jgi:hypothetical protein
MDDADTNMVVKQKVTEDCEYVLKYPAQSLLKTSEDEVWTNPRLVTEEPDPPLDKTDTGKLFLSSRAVDYQQEFTDNNLAICIEDDRQFAKLNAPLRVPVILEEPIIDAHCFGLSISLSGEVNVAGLFDCRGNAQVNGIILPDILPKPWPTIDWTYGGGTTFLELTVPSFNVIACSSVNSELCTDCCFTNSTTPGISPTVQVFIQYRFLFRPRAGLLRNIFAVTIPLNGIITCAFNTDGSRICRFGNFSGNGNVTCGVVPIFGSLDIFTNASVGIVGTSEISCNWRDNDDVINDGTYNDTPILNCDFPPAYPRTDLDDEGNPREHPCG